jgi:hypothetical protein
MNYLCVLFNEKILIISETISMTKEYNIKWHYLNKHSECDEYMSQFRKDKICELKKYTELT